MESWSILASAVFFKAAAAVGFAFRAPKNEARKRVHRKQTEGVEMEREVEGERWRGL